MVGLGPGPKIRPLIDGPRTRKIFYPVVIVVRTFILLKGSRYRFWGPTVIRVKECMYNVHW